MTDDTLVAYIPFQEKLFIRQVIGLNALNRVGKANDYVSNSFGSKIWVEFVVLCMRTFLQF